MSGKGVPIKVVPCAHVPIANDIKRLSGTAVLRMVTEHGMFIIDANFGDMQDPTALHNSLIVILGVVETGLFLIWPRLPSSARQTERLLDELWNNNTNSIV
eukprot:CFRG0101T1